MTLLKMLFLWLLLLINPVTYVMLLINLQEWAIDTLRGEND